MPENKDGISPQEQFSQTEYKQGDRVRLTEQKIQQLRDGGFLEGFPSMEGIVSVVYEDIMSVDFGGAVRRVDMNDVERV
jgi:hypothetical protein